MNLRREDIISFASYIVLGIACVLVLVSAILFFVQRNNSTIGVGGFRNAQTNAFYPTATFSTASTTAGYANPTSTFDFSYARSCIKMKSVAGNIVYVSLDSLGSVVTSSAACNP